MTGMTELREKRVWTGTSPEGLAFEIAFWGEGRMCDGAGIWNYYVIIPEEQLRPEDWAKVWLPVERYYERSSGHREPMYNENSSILDAGNFHGGITFYEKREQVDGDRRWIKVGCDYGHLWDAEAGYSYDLETVRADALATCRDLAKVLNPLVRCTYSGRYFDPRFDMSADAQGWRGSWLSPAGMGIKTGWARRDAERQTQRNAA